MSEPTEATEDAVEQQIAALTKRREAQKAGADKERRAQYALDLVALADLEEQHGADNVVAMSPGGFVKGLPSIMVVKSPSGTGYYGRFRSIVRASKGDAVKVGAAQEQLGESCIVYPSDPEVRKAFFAAFQGATISAGLRAVKFVEADAEDEKKG